MAIRRGELYFVELGPTRGRELDTKRRPVVVLSIDEINRLPLVITVIPGGTRAAGKRVFRHEVEVTPSPANGLKHPTIFQCFQIKALDHSRFDEARVGEMDDEDLRKIEAVVKLCLGLP
jgi:mRNA interferase MazF